MSHLALILGLICAACPAAFSFMWQSRSLSFECRLGKNDG